MTSERHSPLLAVENLRTHIHTDRGTVRAVDGVSFKINRGETVCLVGQSGSGKSVTCESLTGLLPQPPAEFVSGSVTFEGQELLNQDDSTLRAVRGKHIAHLFQNPQQALDPVYSVGDQLVETIRIHEDVSKRAARERAIELLRQVGIPNAQRRIDDYPHEFSGGMAQRVALALALTTDPDLLIADEPTTAVDVTVQARLIELLRELTKDGMAVLLVTHDLRVVASLADRILVMYGGTILERGPIEDVFAQPSHPYTQALFRSYDQIDSRQERVSREDIPTSGCRFQGECQHAVEACTEERPPFYPVDQKQTASDNGQQEVSCIFYNEKRNPRSIRAAASEASPSMRGETDD